MSDSPDELILKMQHLEAQAKESLRARALTEGGKRLRSAAQKLAWEAQQEIAREEQAAEEGEQKLARAKEPGRPPLEAVELLRSGRAQVEASRTHLIKARARLNFALDQMTEVERREYEAFHAEARAETHGQLAEDPLFNKG
jgi:exonuclease VII large subunit